MQVHLSVQLTSSDDGKTVSGAAVGPAPVAALLRGLADALDPPELEAPAEPELIDRPDVDLTGGCASCGNGAALRTRGAGCSDCGRLAVGDGAGGLVVLEGPKAAAYAEHNREGAEQLRRQADALADLEGISVQEAARRLSAALTETERSGAPSVGPYTITTEPNADGHNVATWVYRCSCGETVGGWTSERYAERGGGRHLEDEHGQAVPGGAGARSVGPDQPGPPPTVTSPAADPDEHTPLVWQHRATWRWSCSSPCTAAGVNYASENRADNSATHHVDEPSWRPYCSGTRDCHAATEHTRNCPGRGATAAVTPAAAKR